MTLLPDETRLHRTAAGHLYRIQFYLDESPTPPWDDCGAVPLIWYSFGRFEKKAARGFDLLNPLPYLSDRKITANRETLPKLAEYDSVAALDREARAYYPDSPITEARREMLQDDWLKDGEQSESRLEAIAALWRLAGVPAQVIQSRGYCQGDWAALLVVAHPEAVKGFGFKTMREYRKACPNDLQAAADSWGAWCWGGVVGYEVCRIDPEEWQTVSDDDDKPDSRILNDLGDLVEVGSCWGFYPEGGQDYFPLETAHAYALSQAIEDAESDSADLVGVESAAFVAEMIEARPDLAPQWAGA